MSAVGAPKPGLLATGEEATLSFAVPRSGFSLFLPFRRRAAASARRALPARDALRCGPRDGRAIGLTMMVGI